MDIPIPCTTTPGTDAAQEGDYPNAVDAYQLYLAKVPGDAITIAGLRVLKRQWGHQATGESIGPLSCPALRSPQFIRSDFSPFLAHDDEMLYSSSRNLYPVM